MLQSLLNALTTKPLDVQVWECMPLIVHDQTGKVLYWRETNLEFTPFEDSSKKIGHAIALQPDKEGVQPQISIEIRQYVDNPLMLGRRQGIILQGTDQNDESVTWLINGEADRFALSADLTQPSYDAETAEAERQALESSEPDKLNLNTFN